MAISLCIPPIRLYRTEGIPNLVDELIPKGLEENAIAADQRRILYLARRLQQTSPMRFLIGAKEASWSIIGKSLEEDFPHFAEVTTRIGQCYELARHSRSQLQIPPMLLLGDPGIGKTHYVRRLAEILSLPYRAISMATLTAGFILSGMHSAWADAKPGLVFSQLIDVGMAANQILLLDEIDKAAAIDGRHDPLGPLYDLLEPGTARGFRDEYFPLPLDASQINWIATANRLEGIADPILSRLQVQEVPTPSAEQRRQILPRLYARVLEDRPWGGLFDADLPREVQEQVIARCQTPRAMRQLVEQLCATAAIRIEEDEALWAADEGEEFREITLSLRDFPKTRLPSVAFGFATSLRPATPPEELRKAKRL